jgi:hypothetical protein
MLRAAPHDRGYERQGVLFEPPDQWCNRLGEALRLHCVVRNTGSLRNLG